MKKTSNLKKILVKRTGEKRTPKRRTFRLDKLHPLTAAALAGKWSYSMDETGSIIEIVDKSIDMSKVYHAENVSSNLIGLVRSINQLSGMCELKDQLEEYLNKFKQVSQIALLIDDRAFPEQLHYAMEYSKNPHMRRREAIYKAFNILNSGNKSTNELTKDVMVFEKPNIEDFKKLAELYFGEEISSRTFDDDVVVLGITDHKKRNRGKQ
jgi:hypothetical protein